MLNCASKGHPTPQIQWFQEVSGGLVPFVQVGNLSNSEISPLASGFFTCRAFNTAHQVEKSVNVTVIVPPSLSLPRGLRPSVEIKTFESTVHRRQVPRRSHSNGTLRLATRG